MCLLAIKLIRKIQYTISRRKLQQQFASETVKLLRGIRRPKAANFYSIRLHDLDLSGGVLGLVDDDVLNLGHIRGVKAILTGIHHHAAGI